MPRAPDPGLEERVVRAGLALLDEQGLEAVTMRSIAAVAGTTTPTLYERFTDRDALVKSVIVYVQDDILKELHTVRTARAFVTTYVGYSCRYPHRFELSIQTFGSRLVSAEPMPIFTLLQKILGKETGVDGRVLEDLALAVAALIFGTIQGMIAAGTDHRRAGDLQRACLSALNWLLKAFRRE